MTSENAAVAAATDSPDPLRPFPPASYALVPPPDPVAALAQAILDGRLDIVGDDWHDRDGRHRWSFTIRVGEA